jgi:hypothetical protein
MYFLASVLFGILAFSNDLSSFGIPQKVLLLIKEFEEFPFLLELGSLGLDLFFAVSGLITLFM